MLNLPVALAIATSSPFKAFPIADAGIQMQLIARITTSVDEAVTVTERGDYTFAIRNNSAYPINVSGYVNY